MPMTVTVLEAHVAPERALALQAAYGEAAYGPLPPGLVRSTLLRATDDRTSWRIETIMRVWVVALALATLPACVAVSYQRPGQHITPRRGKTVVFGRLRFFHDGREFFPWEVKLGATPAGTDTERHLWLLRLGERAVSAEVHPDEDGSLAIWLASGDYALVGGTQAMASGSAAFEVVALFRVPAASVAAYAGELSLKTERHEGWHVSHSELGATSVDVQPIDIARKTLEQRLGTLPEPPVVSPWCVGDTLPGFNDPKLAKRARELLDRGCHGAR